ncbi:hypothetical protein E1218_25735 [Kribbella turkmenica]|uniref:Uncharacterized protein n=1 Tax=Kribbella turkmenica TaxID=2530375 RepID=A0A4R4WI05_9ACTN|nr:hypothetical protein [Kribbella turkmenica]TDD18592.1 hypothetical protein E1218_25735 [Kribbella turkmenica]
MRVVRWLAPVLIGLVIAWAGVNDKGRVIVAATSLLALWIVPALITAVSSAAGTRVYARDPSALLDDAQRVFTTTTTTPSTAVPPLLVAVAVATTGLLIRRQLAAPDSRKQAR